MDDVQPRFSREYVDISRDCRGSLKFDYTAQKQRTNTLCLINVVTAHMSSICIQAKRVRKLLLPIFSLNIAMLIPPY